MKNNQIVIFGKEKETGVEKGKKNNWPPRTKSFKSPGTRARETIARA